MTDTYHIGALDAYRTFGVRVAADLSYSRRLPEGDLRLGAEALARALSQEAEGEYAPAARPPRTGHRDKPLQWGPRTSLEASPAIGGFSPGMRDGGV